MPGVIRHLQCLVLVHCRTDRPAATSAEGPKFGVGQHRSSDLREALRLDQAAADRVAGEVDAVAHAEPVEDVGAVPFDRLDAEHEQFGDLF